MGELTPVVQIDGRKIGEGARGPITQQLQEAYRTMTKTAGLPIPGF